MGEGKSTYDCEHFPDLPEMDYDDNLTYSSPPSKRCSGMVHFIRRGSQDNGLGLVVDGQEERQELAVMFHAQNQIIFFDITDEQEVHLNESSLRSSQSIPFNIDEDLEEEIGGIFPLNHHIKIISAEKIKVNLKSLPRWKPKIDLGFEGMELGDE